MRLYSIALIGCVISLLTAGPAMSCQVPVFRYALEHWQPDRLDVIILHEGPLAASHLQLVDRLQAAATDETVPVNLRVGSMDTSQDSVASSRFAQALEGLGDEPLPRLLVFFNSEVTEPQLAWSGPLDEPSVERLLSSPHRVEVVKRLLDGQSAVWVLLKSGDEAADRRAEEQLQQQLVRQQELIELPSLADLATEDAFDPTLGIELRVEFSLLTIDPEDPAEQFLRSMLLATEPDLKDYPKPIAIPIYGRGRTYFALVGDGITPENIEDNCRFICGACSCEVKGQNPGHDLLLAADWEQVVPGNWGNPTPLPALTGIGQFEAMVDDGPTPTETVAKSEDRPAGDVTPAGGVITSGQDGSADSSTSATERSTSTLIGRLLLGWVGVLVCIGLVVTFLRRQG